MVESVDEQLNSLADSSNASHGSAQKRLSTSVATDEVSVLLDNPSAPQSQTSSVLQQQQVQMVRAPDPPASNELWELDIVLRTHTLLRRCFHYQP